jgi:hypothetical protein
MSTWRVGEESGTAAVSAGGVAFDPEAAAVDRTVRDSIDRLTKWIPGDALALYVAAVTAFAASEGARPSPVLLIVFVVLSAGFVLGAAFASTGEIPRATMLPAVLAAAAFTIWTLSVPFSGWHRWDFVSDNQAAVAIIAAIAGVVFGFFAEGLTKRAERRRAQRLAAERRRAERGGGEG